MSEENDNAEEPIEGSSQGPHVPSSDETAANNDPKNTGGATANKEDSPPQPKGFATKWLLVLLITAAIGYFVYLIELQPLANVIYSLRYLYGFLILYFGILSFFRDFHPKMFAEIQLLKTCSDFLSEEFTFPFSQSFKLPKLYLVPIIAILIVFLVGVSDSLRPLLAFKNSRIVIYCDKSECDKYVEQVSEATKELPFLNNIHHENADPEKLRTNFNKLKPEDLAVLNLQSTLAYFRPKEINALFCTEKSEILAKLVAKRLHRAGIRFKHIGAIEKPKYKDESEIQIGRSYIPILFGEDRPFTNEQIDQASCAS